MASSAFAQLDVENRTFLLFNHHDGAVAPPLYGLRLDGFLTGDTADRTTFSFESPSDTKFDPEASTMLLNVATDTDTGDITITIFGTIFGGVDGGTEYVDPQNYSISFSYTENVEEFDGGWRVTGQNNAGNTGTITPLDSQGDSTDLLTLTDSDANAFYLTPTGELTDDGDTIFKGVGWLTSDATGEAVKGTQDWKFKAIETDPIPTPGSVALIALAGATLGTRRRR